MANTLPYGINITASDMRNIIEQNDKQQTGIRSWRQLFGNASLGYEAQADALKTDYNKAIADAYAANFQQQNNLMGQGLNVGATQELIGMNRQDLLSAYSNYMRDYQNAQNEVAQTYQDEVGMIDTALNERAENFANLYNSAYQYLAKELVGSTHLVTDPDTPLYYENKEEGTTTTEGGKGKEYAGQAKKPEDIAIGQGLGWLVDPDSGQALPWEQLSTLLFDDSGALTQRGIQYFDQLMNMRPEGYTKADGTAVKSFDAWLAEENPELRTWFASADPFNYTFKGTNAGTAAAYAGRESTDEAYNEGEYTKAQDIVENTLGIISTFNKLGDNASKFAQEALDIKNRFKENPDAGKNGGASAGIQVIKDRINKSKTEWQNYSKEVEKNFSSLTDTLQKSFGTDAYNSFYSDNEVLFKNFESLISNLAGTEFEALFKDPNGKISDKAYVADPEVISTYYNKQIAKINNAYNAIIRAAQRYAEGNADKGISGF